jgi:hypothetical protein
MDAPRPRTVRERQQELAELKKESAYLLAGQRLAERRHETEKASFYAKLRAHLKVWIEEYGERNRAAE